MARRLVEETSVNIFLTGKAGTGKTTFLKRLKEESAKNMVVLAPTGIAAVNAQGVTIHSFFQLPFDPFLPGMEQKKSHYRFGKDKIKIIRSIDLLVIDEVSMVKADLLDAIDDSLRRYRDPTSPFGGVQLLLIGDLSQLPPVLSPEERELYLKYYDTEYFFSSHALKQTDYVTIELEKVYRQDDGEFLEILNRIRDNKCDLSLLERINSRYIPGFNPDEKEGYIRLTTHNASARQLNTARLQAIDEEESVFTANISGDFPESSYPADFELHLKPGAQVMFLKNDPERRFYNGMIGIVESIDEDSISVRPTGEDTEIIVERMEWENTKYELSADASSVESKVIGTFTQFPLRLAWAITIHKSQGLTFDKAIIDASRSFTHGQTYVALSRCRTMEGLVLERPLQFSAIICDSAVSDFSRQTRVNPDEQMISQLKFKYNLNLFVELFSMRMIRMTLENLKRDVDTFLAPFLPDLKNEYDSMLRKIKDRAEPVAEKFVRLYANSLVSDTASEDETAKNKLSGAVDYFTGILADIPPLLNKTFTDIDNAAGKRRLISNISLLRNLVILKLRLLSYSSKGKFSAATYLKIKSETLLQLEASPSPDSAPKRKTANREKTPPSESDNRDVEPAPVDIPNKKLFETLRRWRLRISRETGKPAFTVLSTKSLIDICEKLPTSKSQLMGCHGIGNTKYKNFGDEVIQMVAEYLEKMNPFD